MGSEDLSKNALVANADTTSNDDAWNGRDQLARVREELDPRSSLPLNLQEISFEQDLWRRMKEHPVPGPRLTRGSLLEDPTARECIRQTMAAAGEREKEILLHNQARVFSQMLMRAFESVRHFLNTPIAPRSWVADARAVKVIDRDSEPQANSRVDSPAQATAGESLKKETLMKVVVAFLTPKVFLSVAAALFALIAGYSRVQVMNLQEAVDSYKTAAEAAGNAESNLTKQLDSIQSGRDARLAEIDGLTNRAAILEKEKRDKELEIIALTSDRDLQQNIASDLKKKLESARSQEAKDVRELQERLEARAENEGKLEGQLRKARAEIEAIKIEKGEADQGTSRALQAAKARSEELDGLMKENRKLNLEVQTLKTQTVLLRFAETFIDKMKKQVGSYHNPNESEIQQALREYKAAKKNLARGK